MRTLSFFFRRLCLSIAVLELVGSTLCLAQDDKPNEFYPKGFAADTIHSKTDSDAKKTPVKRRLEKQPAPPTVETPVEAVVEMESESNPTPHALPRATDRDSKPGIPVRFLSLYVRADPRPKVVEALGNYAKVIMKYPKIKRGDLFFIGNPYEYTEKEEEALTQEAGVAPNKKVLELPPFLESKVTRSPVWVLETDKGKVVLEGVKSIEPYLDSNGAFVDDDRERSK